MEITEIEITQRNIKMQPIFKDKGKSTDTDLKKTQMWKLSDNDFEIVVINTFKIFFFNLDMMNEQREISAKKWKLFF